jgi:ATP phosphoribosyltransferase
LGSFLFLNEKVVAFFLIIKKEKMSEKYYWRKYKDESKVATPNSGEWGSSIKKMLTAAEIRWEQTSERSYGIYLPRLKVTLVTTRAKDVPRLVMDDRSDAVAGMTGTDILIEKGLQKLKGQPVGWPVPLTELDPQAPQPKIYLASTPNDYNGDDFYNPSLKTVTNGSVVTSYPNLARQYFDAKGYPQVEIEEFAGSIEGIWQLLSACFAVVDVTVTGTTAEANALTVLETILLVQLKLIENTDKMNDGDKRRIEDFKDALTEGVKLKRFRRIFGTNNNKWVTE